MPSPGSKCRWNNRAEFWEEAWVVTESFKHYVRTQEFSKRRSELRKRTFICTGTEHRIEEWWKSEKRSTTEWIFLATKWATAARGQIKSIANIFQGNNVNMLPDTYHNNLSCDFCFNTGGYEQPINEGSKI